MDGIFQVRFDRSAFEAEESDANDAEGENSKRTFPEV
jgi:hypothetical protein